MTRNSNTSVLKRGTHLASKSLLAASIAAAMMATAGAASAQEEGAAKELEEIVVTGSRLKRDGMQTPTPVTILNADDLNKMAPGSLIEGISQLPQFFGNQGLNTGGSWFTNAGYGNLNLRGLGVNRTLTLLNGRRMISATAFGGVDINFFPEAMIKSVETVTGGASAAYGADAVAGVANFILDTDFTGFQATAQTGESFEDDAGNNEYSFSFGADIGEKGHIQVSYEKAEQDMVKNFDDRGWYEGYGYIFGTFEVAPNIVSAGGSKNGLIFAPGTPLQGLQFSEDGQSVSPFVRGDISSPFPTGVPPANHSITNGGSGDDYNNEVSGYGLMPDHERETIFVYADYELTDNLKVYGQYINGETDTFQYNNTSASFHATPTAVTIFQDNAFLPDSVRQLMVDNGIQSFGLRKKSGFDDLWPETWIRTENESTSMTFGFDWNIDGGMFEGWDVSAYYQKGENERQGYQHGLRVDRLFAAADAVVDPATGNIVCRTTLFSDAFAGCQPVNLFGQGNISPAAADYLTGFEPGQQITTPLYYADSGFEDGKTHSYTTGTAKVNNTYMDQDLFDLSFAGQLAEGWAGPIDLAFGYSHRREDILQIVEDVTNQSSDHVNGKPVRCSDESIGLRGVSVPDCLNTVGVQYSKVSNIKGEIEVDEFFAETNIPLISGGMMEQVTLNLAARWADYSTSGGIWAWKTGLDAQITQDFRFRGTLSRDIRAPNLSELYDKTGGSATVTDPITGQTGNVTFFSGGNPDLDPEEADTITLGFVYQPSFVEGLSMSIDWYEVDIDGAIGSLGVQGMVNACQAGDQTACSFITRNPDDNTLVLVGNPYINIDREVTSGVDFEVSYNSDVDLFGGAGESIGARLFVSYLDESSETNGGAAKIDRAGQTGIQPSDGVHYALPEWKWTAQLTYNYGDFTAFLQGRYIGEGVNQNNAPAAFDVNGQNDVDSVFYTDMNLSYGYTMDNGLELEVFGNVTNLFDEEPPVTPYYSAFLQAPDQVNELLFDQIGRRYTAGIRLRY